MTITVFTTLRFPLVALSFIVAQVRRLPGAALVARHTPLAVTVLLAAALVALAFWSVQRSPQRISVAELSAGGLSPMQSWIIVSGELRAAPSTPSGYRYVLTDPAAPNSELIVVSELELPLGQATVSGTLIGGRVGVPAGYRWIGMLSADPILARDQDPPWLAIGLTAAALLVGVVGRIPYPMFFHHQPRRAAHRSMTLQVGVSRGSVTSAGRLLAGAISLRPGSPVELRVAGFHPQQLRLHSAHTSVEVGELRRLSDSQPALVVHPASGDLVITFASLEERDAAFTALVADAESRAYVRWPGVQLQD